MREWLRADEAAVLLGVKVGHVHVLAHRRRWRRWNVDGRTVYATDDVTREMSDRAASVPAEEGR